MNGERILDLLDRQAEGPVAIIVRHADRHEIKSVTQSLGVGLNEKGKEDARRFGERMSGHHDVRVFHSPAVRCRETAEAIAAGMTVNGNRVTSITETWALCAPYLKDERTLEEADRLGHGFMRAWFDHRLDKDWILPTPEAADLVLSPILKHLAEPGGADRLDIHVSHDWEIVLMRDELFGTRFEEAGWIEYLDGIAFCSRGTGFRAMVKDAQTDFGFASGRRC